MSPELTKPRPARSLWAALGLPLALGAFVLLQRLGSPSLFVDEAYSWHAAAAHIGVLLHRVRVDEVAPPTYYLLLHGWINLLGSDSESALRLLSAIAGLGLVGLTFWLADQLGGRLSGALAATAMAISPLLLQYGQEARAYVFAMAAVTLAGAAAVRAHNGGSSRQRWLAISALAAVAAPWLHYSSVLVIVPLAAWVGLHPGFSARSRRMYVGVAGVALVAVAPFAIAQLGRGHQGGVAPVARLTAGNLLRVLGTPFDGRNAGPAALRVLATIALVAALALLVRRGARAASPEWLIAACASVPVLAIVAETLAADIVGQPTYDALITRYTAVGAPFMVAALALAVTSVRRPAALALGLTVVVACASGLISSEQRSHYPPDLRDPFAAVGRGLGAQDTLVLSTDVASPPTSDYYVARLRRRRPRASVVSVTLGPPLSIPRPPGSRTWLIAGSRPVTHSESESTLVRSGEVVVSVQRYVPASELLVGMPPGPGVRPAP
jgi:mannosyltransferase